MERDDGLNKFESHLYQRVHENQLGQLHNRTIDIKLKIKNILNVEEVRDIFISYGYKSYYDLYFIKLDDFRNILIKNNLGYYYNEITGEALGRLSKPNIEIFGNTLGFIKGSYSELVSYITNDLSSRNINSINDLISMRVVDFIDIVLNDSKYRYLIRTFSKNKFGKIKHEELIKFGLKLCLKELDINKLKVSILNILKLNNINNTRDLNNIYIRDFRKIAEENFLIKYYFLYILKLKISYIREAHIKIFFTDIGLISNFNQNEEIRLFLLHNKLKDYGDFKSINRDELKSLLWNNEACKKILNDLGVTLLRDIRDEHFQKFARRIGLKGVQKYFEYDENEAKNILKLSIKKIGVSSKDDLFSKGIRIIKKISKDCNLYERKMIQTFIKQNFGISVSNLRLNNLNKLIELLGLFKV